MTKEEKVWELFLIKREALYRYGINNKLIHCYEEELIENLRHIYYCGVPASIILLCSKLCQGFCFDRGLLITLGFGEDDFKLVTAEIDTIKLNPEHSNLPEGFAKHCFAERTKKNGTTWVYDTSTGLVYEKELYYEIERPRISKINDKESIINFEGYQDIKNADVENDKYALPGILPNIEEMASNGQNLYEEALKREIERFKQEINYDAICEEVNRNVADSELDLMLEQLMTNYENIHKRS